MRNLLAIVAAGSLIANTASAAICVGKNCELLDLMARNVGLSLDQILSEIDRNIVEPTVDNQKNLSSWEGGMIQFTPRGSTGFVKMTLWGGGAWKHVNISSTMFGVPISVGYYTANTSLSLGLEIPAGEKTDLVLNGSFWSGPSDYGLGLSKGEARETNGKFGIGLRQKLYSSGITDVYALGGFVTGFRESDMTLKGTTVAIGLPGGVLTWSGEEKYYEKSSYASIPVLLGMAFNYPWMTLSLSGGGSVIFQGGKIDLSKTGPVGPFGGFRNVGILSEKDTSGPIFAPAVVIGAESPFKQGPSVSVNFRPGFNRFPAGGSIGIGWQFLSSSKFILKFHEDPRITTRISPPLQPPSRPGI